jgi:uncharacterized protein (DUF697 family)
MTELLPENRQRTLLLYALLTGLTPLIPVPFADDLAKGHLRRQLVHRLALAHGRNLSGNTVEALTRESSGGGCLLGGCLAQALLYPIKKVFRKIFFFLEWKRAIDLTSYTYHWGYLVDYALQEGLLESPGSDQTNPRAENLDNVRTAIEKACQEVPLQPIERAVSATLRQSRAVLLSAANRIGTSLKGVVAGQPEAQQTVYRATEPAQNEQIRGVAALLQQRIAAAVPEEHFQQLRQRFRAHLTH